MISKPPLVPAKTMRTASVVILIFAAALILFGLNMFQLGLKDAKTAKDLQASGLAGTVIDARPLIARLDDGLIHTLGVELTFVDAAGEKYTLETDHLPEYYSPSNLQEGLLEDSPSKDLIVGQPVTYRLGKSPAVELTSELPVIASEGWSFPNYLGIALTVMGCGAAIGGVVSVVRATRRLR